MGARPYSVRFIGTTASNSQVNYVVPLGFRAVVKAIHGVSFGAVGGTIYVNAGPWNVWFVRIQEQPQRLSAEIRAVVYAGESIGCFIDAPATSLTVAGYLFVDPEGADPSPKGGDQGDQLDLLTLLEHGSR